ncbi:aminodeoxychorismate synthase component I [Pelotalea chapellei]|uniref:Aminodeoxychorismate synthase component I n=1 Tax=Pelotalea chapellei TaxID=44671 RepID=A0ABS5UAF4_9BACT|nr:aminodeoxychorismate synthase component I [Pelotalea chapellei]MBT1072664.1 aminodeoxychorismate synthase component I [Pelotalea chapellei]
MTEQITPQQPTALLESFSTGPFAHSFRFEGQESVITAATLEQVIPALTQVEQAVARGRHAVGFIAYEAAAALNPELATKAPGNLPLIWFGIFRERISCLPGSNGSAVPAGDMSPPELAITRESYTSSVEEIREAIARGDTYQVNYTTRQRFSVAGDTFSLYRRMCRNQQAPFCAWLDIGSHQILSASPELFFSLQGDLITMKPMKGTAARLPDADADQRQRDQLNASPKERAENLMIVDLIRNDLSMIAETGSVTVPTLFEVETFPTVHQMTSTVTAQVRPQTGLIDILRALFPCGSVTGAPKRRTMEIISELETSPRGVYCGAIGYVSPGREALFSVAIRTAVIDTTTGTGEIGIGSGITWDSDPEAEYRECLAKSAFMYRDSQPFQLIESIRHDANGYLLLERHLARLSNSADHFGFRFDSDNLAARLDEVGRNLAGPHKVRVLLTADGSISVEAQPISGPFNHPPLQVEGGGGDGVEGEGTKSRLAISDQRMDSSDPFLYHKTTHRELYERELRQHPDCYDVIFLNERDEITEGCFNNIVIRLEGELLSPTLSSGLLPGVLRQELLEAGAVREAVLTMKDLLAAEKIWLINSVRGWRECRLPPS